MANFKNTTGYVKKPTYKPQGALQQTMSSEIDKKVSQILMIFELILTYRKQFNL